MATTRGGYNATPEVIGALCNYFGCGFDDVLEYIPKSDPGKPAPKPGKSVTKTPANVARKASRPAK